MKFKKWNLAPPDPEAQRQMEAAGVNPLAAAVLCARGLDTVEKARDFLSCEESLLLPPLEMADMDRAVKRVRLAWSRGEIIAVYGDYDVDGITSTCLLTDYLRRQGGQVIPYIPDRMEEGYGLNNDAVRSLAERGVTLIITVDCGITAVREVEYAASLGVDVIVTDHHECKEELPPAAAVVDPHRRDCPYRFKELAGVGVALKLVLALAGPDRQPELLREYADLAAIGTVADVMRIGEENRAIVKLGLEQLSHTRRPGLAMLLREAGMEGKKLTSVSIGFSLAPRINASGRMGCAGLATELLLTDDPRRGEELARELCALNRERQAIELEIYEECLQRLERCPPEERAAVVLSDSRWHQGVVGIVASRLSEKFACPTFMICTHEGKGKGSCRSYGGFNLFAALERNADLLESYGGHELAAGFTIREENIPAFRSRMNREVVEALDGEEAVTVLPIDAEIPRVSLLTQENVADLSRMEPYGTGNPRPTFALMGATVVSLSAVGGGRHLKLRLGREGRTLDAIFFSATAQDAGIRQGERVDVAFYPQINEFRGQRTVQLLVTDLRPALSVAQAERQLYERYRQGQPLTPQEAAALTPSREDFAAVWRYLKRQAGPGWVEETAPRLCRKIARAFGTRETFTRTMVCLEVFDERGLISLSTRTDHLQISLRPVEGKVDLEQSDIMRRLRRLAQS